MKNHKFPIFKTKIKGVDRKFHLSDPKERQVYFLAKAGPEIKKLKEYLRKNTFVAYLLGKKNSGKGTYTKLLNEALGGEKIAHISIGDIVRDVHRCFSEKTGQKELTGFLKKNYRGYLSLEQCLEGLLSRDTKTLLPTEFILALVKREISQMPKQTLFIDGFPRNLDQVSYSLYFRDLIGYRDDSDIFVLIDVPEQVINERMKYRVACPCCQTPRNRKLLPTNEVIFDKSSKEFHLICDEPKCQGAKMLAKEGDELGIEVIRERLETDEKLISLAFSIHGVPKIFLRNSVPTKEAKRYVDDYEITPEYSFQWDEKLKKVRVKEKPWILKDDQGEPSYSLLAAPVVISLIKQLVQVLGL